MMTCAQPHQLIVEDLAFKISIGGFLKKNSRVGGVFKTWVGKWDYCAFPVIDGALWNVVLGSSIIHTEQPVFVSLHFICRNKTFCWFDRWNTVEFISMCRRWCSPAQPMMEWQSTAFWEVFGPSSIFLPTSVSLAMPRPVWDKACFWISPNKSFWYGCFQPSYFDP